MKGGLLLKDKHIRILFALRDTTQSWYIANLAKASNTTYVHTCNFLAACESLGITGSEKHGKIKLIKLTERGAKLTEMLANAYALINTVEKKEPEAQPKPVEAQKEKA
jgi:predicted transcriptional regulator